ncbi:Insl5 [Columba guinea]|nr:Insl5 [Columba guinea]
MRSTVLALALLALLAAARQGSGEGNTVRLCGRDFVRAVVFTCGGSRWKRDLTDYHYLLASNSYVTESENPLPFSQDTNGYADSSMNRDQRLETNSEAIQVKPETERDLDRARKMTALKKREIAKLLTTSCCNIGCSEKDISSLC